MNEQSSNWWVYIIETIDGHYYTGITTDVERRFTQHSLGKGAKYFRSHSPRAVIWREAQANRSSASKREIQIKQLNHGQKQRLIAAPQILPL